MARRSIEGAVAAPSGHLPSKGSQRTERQVRSAFLCIQGDSEPALAAPGRQAMQLEKTTDENA